MFEDWLSRWKLEPDGAEIMTPTSHLLPVRRAGIPAMLKVAHSEEERCGAALMAWWAGDGAARVLAHEGDAILLERALGKNSLADMARAGRDDDATRILCAVAARLHAARSTPAPPTLVPLLRWFSKLDAAATQHGGLFATAAATAHSLLAEPREPVVLHGDLHHGNVLDAESRGWIATDPKGLFGERAFDFANLFCNPDTQIAAPPGRLARHATIVAEAAHLERVRLLRWILAYAGLSAAWSLTDGGDPALALSIAEQAARSVTPN